MDDSSKDLAELAAALPEGKDIARISKNELAGLGTEKVGAVLFIPDNSSLEDDLDIRVVGLSEATLAAMVARRC